jgi:hypothetical protein
LLPTVPVDEVWERAEVDDRITLRSLRACADALDCDLVYAFVPRGATIEKTLAARVRAAASHTVHRVEHSMALEDQSSGNLDQAVEAATRRVRRSGTTRRRSLRPDLAGTRR